jgi:hypothetical protein
MVSFSSMIPSRGSESFRQADAEARNLKPQTILRRPVVSPSPRTDSAPVALAEQEISANVAEVNQKPYQGLHAYLLHEIGSKLQLEIFAIAGSDSQMAAHESNRSATAYEFNIFDC